MEFRTLYGGLSTIKDVSDELEETLDLPMVIKKTDNNCFCEIGFNDDWDISDEELKKIVTEKVSTGKFTISAKWILDKNNLTELIKILSIVNNSLEES